MLKNLSIPKSWGVIALLNLFIGSLLGIAMRYKINYPLPGVSQGNLLHAHQHFIFHGWATLILITGFIAFLLRKDFFKQKSYSIIFWAIQILSFGLLLSFGRAGYTYYSISLIILTQFVLYWFSIKFLIDVKKSNINKYTKYIAQTAVICLLIASIGAYMLAYYSITGKITPIFTRGALYFYLHFQYNGWFSFAIIALFLAWMQNKKISFNSLYLKRSVILFMISILPGFCLSLIGYLDSYFVYIFSYLAVICQLAAVFYLVKVIWDARPELSKQLSIITQVLWGTALLALVGKTILQTFSTQPSLAIVAFSLRPLVIGYLHLIFICLLSYFMFGLMFEEKVLNYSSTKLAKIGLWGFLVSSILNEIVLFLQAAGFYFSFIIRNIPITLFYITIVMSFTLLLFWLPQRKTYAD